MNWLISLVMAGIMFSSESSLPTNKNYNRSESYEKNVVKQDETERFEQSYPVNASGRVSVSNVNGSITIETWDKSEVKLEYVKTADTRERLTEVEVKIDARPDYFQVETDYENWKRRNNNESRNNGKLQIEYRLLVPRNAVLNEIETVNGSISISNAANTTRASAVNGEVRATNLRGTTNLSTVNGTVTAEFDQLETASKISLNTVNGQVNLVIPSDANATVKADTVNGSINNDFGLPVRKGQYVGKDLYGRIGSGNVQIRLNSVNGGLSLKRKNDGKNLNPATNLLPQKSKIDDDLDKHLNDNIDDDVDNDIEEDKKNAPRIARKVKTKQKEIEKALKEAQREIAKIQPELEKINVEALKQASSKINIEELQVQIREAQKLAISQLSDANWFSSSPKIEKKSDSFIVKGTPLVTIEAKNCDVNVRGWDKSEVSYSVVKISRSNQKKPLDTDSAISIKAGDSEVNIKVSEETTSNGGLLFDDAVKMRIQVFVPKKSNLRIQTNKEIRLENVSGELELQGGNETINVRDSGGTLRVSSSDGMIRILGFNGELDSKTVAGMMNLDGDFQKLSARTVEGTIILTLPENANVNIESNRKDIKSDGVPLVYVGDGKSTSTWKVGKGGENFLLYTTADGKVFIRSANTMNTDWQ